MGSCLVFNRKVFFVIFFNILFIFRERGREGDRQGEKHQWVVASDKPPTGDLARNAGMCPDWESNGYPLVQRPALSPLSHTSQGLDFIQLGIHATISVTCGSSSAVF